MLTSGVCLSDLGKSLGRGDDRHDRGGNIKQRKTKSSKGDLVFCIVKPRYPKRGFEGLDNVDVHFLSTFLPKKKKQGESLAFKSRQTERMESVEDGLESTRGVG